MEQFKNILECVLCLQLDKDIKIFLEGDCQVLVFLFGNGELTLLSLKGFLEWEFPMVAEHEDSQNLIKKAFFWVPPQHSFFDFPYVLRAFQKGCVWGSVLFIQQMFFECFSCGRHCSRHQGYIPNTTDLKPCVLMEINTLMFQGLSLPDFRPDVNVEESDNLRLRNAMGLL